MIEFRIKHGIDAYRVSAIVSISEEVADLARLSVPKQFRRGIVVLAGLPDEDYLAFLALLETGIVVDKPEALGQNIADVAPSVDGETLAEAVIALASLQSVFRTSHASSSAFAADVYDSFRDDSPGLISNLVESEFKKRVEELVTGKVIHITSIKIRRLRSEVEREFCRARILTDVRTAFSDDGEETPQGMAVIHTLQIGYHAGSGKHQEIYFSLDDADLGALKEAIERAEKKKKNLKEILQPTNCPLYE